MKNSQINSFKKLMKMPIIIDGRNCFDLQEVKKYNIIYETIGRPVINTINKNRALLK